MGKVKMFRPELIGSSATASKFTASCKSVTIVTFSRTILCQKDYLEQVATTCKHELNFLRHDQFLFLAFWNLSHCQEYCLQHYVHVFNKISIRYLQSSKV